MYNFYTTVLSSLKKYDLTNRLHFFALPVYAEIFQLALTQWAITRKTRNSWNRQQKSKKMFNSNKKLRARSTGQRWLTNWPQIRFNNCQARLFRLWSPFTGTAQQRQSPRLIVNAPANGWPRKPLSFIAIVFFFCFFLRVFLCFHQF